MKDKMGIIQLGIMVSILVALFAIGLVYAITSGKGLGYTDDLDALTIKMCSVTIYNPLIGKPVIEKYSCVNTRERCLFTLPRTLGIFTEDITLKLVGYDDQGVQSDIVKYNIATTESKTFEIEMCSKSHKGGIILSSKESGKLDSRDVSFG